MLESFLFIPASKPRYFSALEKLSPDHFVFDLEDSIVRSEKQAAIDNLGTVGLHGKSVHVRLDLTEDMSSAVESVKVLYPKFRKFILPKIENADFLLEFSDRIKPFVPVGEQSFILTIESPRAVMNLPEILRQAVHLVTGISFGSHDYCRETNAVHEIEYFNVARQMVLNTAKAFGLFCIDFASTDLKDEEKFRSECLNGFHMGFDAKPALHPRQLELIHTVEYYTKEELDDALSIYHFLGNSIPDQISAVRMDDQIIETPRLKKVKRIIDFMKKTKYPSL